MKHLAKLFINKPDWKRDRTPHTNKRDSEAQIASPPSASLRELLQPNLETGMN